MEYNIKAHPTDYAGVKFRSRLEARWAAFFDLAGWKWEYEPIDLYGWVPDLFVSWLCGHSECNGSHSILAEIKPYFSVEEFKGHPCMDYPFGHKYGSDGYITDICIPADASAALGVNPCVSYWEMTHGAGGGVETIKSWINEADEMWKIAGNTTKYNPSKRV